MMTRKDLLVTVITPTYNQADYLDETIQSVLNQDYPNLEYIVLDDGSKDNTIEILKKHGDRIIWDSHPNMGEARTVNKGFSLAKGEIISVVNSDDPLLPGAIQNIVRLMCENPEIGVAYPDWNMIDADGRIIRRIQTFDYSYINMLRWHHCVPGPGTFFRRDVMSKLNGRDPQFRYVSDFDFWLRAGLITDFARIPVTMATFRMHAGSASSSQASEDMAEEHIRLINKIYSLPYITDEALKVKREAYGSAYYIAGCVCQTCDLSVRNRYFLTAVARNPLKYLFEYRKRWGTIIPITFKPLYHFALAIKLIFTNPRELIMAIKRKLKVA